MKTVTVKDLVIGTGAPKIIVSLMAKDIASVKSEALAYREADFDILEWRVDHYADLSNVESVMAAAKILRETMPEKPLLFTFRSAKEGGEQAISTEAYIALNRAAIDSGLVDMIDLELFTGDDQVKETVAYAHAHDVKVVMSNHDFHKTPEAEEIIARLRKMQYPLLWERIQGEGQRNYGFFRSEAAAQASHSFDEAYHGALPRTSGKTNCSQTAPFSKRKKLSCRSFSTAAL